MKKEGSVLSAFVSVLLFCVFLGLSSGPRAEMQTLPSAENAVSLFSQRDCLHASESVDSKERSRPPWRNVQEEGKGAAGKAGGNRLKRRRRRRNVAEKLFSFHFLEHNKNLPWWQRRLSRLLISSAGLMGVPEPHRRLLFQRM